MAPLRTQVAGRTGSMQPSTLHHMSYRCRSHSVVRVPRSHTPPRGEEAPSHRAEIVDLVALRGGASSRAVIRPRLAPSWLSAPTTSASPPGSAPAERLGGSVRPPSPRRRLRPATALRSGRRPTASNSVLRRPGSSPGGRRFSRRSCKGSRCGRPPDCSGSPATPSTTTSWLTACLDAATAPRHPPTARATLTESLTRYEDRIADRRQSPSLDRDRSQHKAAGSRKARSSGSVMAQWYASSVPVQKRLTKKCCQKAKPLAPRPP